MAERDHNDNPSSAPGERSAPEDDELGGWANLFPDLDEPGKEKKPVVPVQPPVQSGRRPASAGAVPSLDDLAGEAPPPSGPLPAPDPGPIASPPDQAAPKSRRKFEGNRVAEAFISNEDERPPYAPKGYDPLPEHVPAIAAVLSGVAPGAGQVYNGEDTRGVQYGLRFLGIRPWIASVHQAREQAERIRTYYAPRPIKGSFLRALRYILLFWFVVIGVGVCMTWLVQGVWEASQKVRHEAYQIEVGDVVTQAAVNVQNARVDAMTAILRHQEEHGSGSSEFIMGDEERAQRLYIIGYEYCRRGDHTLCAEIMNRVNTLAGGSRNAFRLQTWASVRSRGGSQEPMPDVGEVPSLANFEFELEREVLGLPPSTKTASKKKGGSAADGTARPDDQEMNEDTP